MAVKHQPKFYLYYAKKSVNFVSNFKIYPGSIYGRFANSEGKPVFWVCDNYMLIDKKLSVHIYNGNYWKIIFVSPSHPCYKYVMRVIEKLGIIPKVDTENLTHKDYEQFMKADTKHKKGNGNRINTYQLNQPLKWNEVTEAAHWYGKGKASIVASNIK